MSVLDKKLFRDLQRLKGQVLTIALVVACGISSYITMRTAYDSLLRSRDLFYAEARFADAFAGLKRAPGSVRAELETIAGVARVDTRVVERVLVPVEGMPRPASGTIVSHDHREARSRLNDVHLMRGRDLDPSRPDEILLLEAFAEAHGLGPGDTLQGVINGTLRKLRIAGTVMSPEYVMALAPGQFSYDPAQVPVVWMDERSLQAAFRMEGGFNSVTFLLEPTANTTQVLADVDRALRPYGGFGAVLRSKQPSNYMLEGELQQLSNMAGFVPYLFLFVAALLVNVVLSRLVQLQRNQIATLKAVGYRDLAIGLHYLKLVSVMVTLGALLGVALGAWFGSEMTGLYTGRYFRFPDARYRMQLGAVVFSVGISVSFAVLGAWWAVKQVVTLPPAEAMRPAAPARFGRTLFELVGVWKFLGPTTRMVLRELSRRKLRLLLSSVGISLATGLVVVSRSMWDGIDRLVDVQFNRAMREDLTVTFMGPLSHDALGTLARLPGVFQVEGLRSVPVRIQAGHRYRDSVINGYPEGGLLRRVLDGAEVVRELPRDGVLLTDKLGEVLDVRVGDTVTVHLREGDFAVRHVVIAGFVEEPFGLQAHMARTGLDRMLRDAGAINTALLLVDPERTRAIEERLKEMPWVASVSSPNDFRRQFDEQSAAIVDVFTWIMTLFAAVIAIGVIYNNARVALSQRTRDLASMRVLGYTRREIASILFGEQAVQVALAIPIGLVVGYWLSEAMMSNVDPEVYRFPVMVSERTYLFAVAVTLGSAVASALILRRRLDRIDLIGVLKTRE